MSTMNGELVPEIHLGENSGQEVYEQSLKEEVHSLTQRLETERAKYNDAKCMLS